MMVVDTGSLQWWDGLMYVGLAPCSRLGVTGAPTLTVGE